MAITSMADYREVNRANWDDRVPAPARVACSCTIQAVK